MEIQLQSRPVCRTCETSSRLSLVTSVPNLHNLLVSLLNIRNIPMYEFVCWPCIQTLENFQALRTKSQRVEEKLQGLCSSVSTYNHSDATLSSEIDIKVEEPSCSYSIRYTNSPNETVNEAESTEYYTEFDSSLPPLNTILQPPQLPKPASRPKVNQAKQMFICDHCQKTFMTRQALHSHMLLAQ